jgi:hypothetical protein
MPQTITGEGYREFSEPRFFECETVAHVRQIRNPCDKAFALMGADDGSTDFTVYKFNLASVTADDGSSVLKPSNPAFDATGRWIKIPTGGGGGGPTGDVAFTDTDGALSVESSVADGASAVAIGINTSNELTTEGAKLVSVKNASTEKIFVNPAGGLISGEDHDNIEGPYNSPGFRAVSMNSLDGQGQASFYGHAIDSGSFLREASVFGNATQSGPIATLSAFAAGDKLDTWTLSARGDANTSSFTFNGDVMALTPGVADGASAIAYRFNTSNAMTNAGARIVTFEVNGAIKMAVAPASSAGQTALLLYDADNNTLERVTVGAADSGGSGFKVLRIPN